MLDTRFVIGLALSSLLVAGCGGGADEADTEEGGQDTALDAQEGAQEGEGAAAEKEGPTELASLSETFEPYGDGVEAAAYDEEAVPEGATIDVTVTEESEGSAYTVAVTGLEADRDFGAHLHTDPCGADPADSGPHYQDEADPEADADTPSANPEYANPENEVWLDFTTDSEGNAAQQAKVDWLPREGEANSIVLHEEHTAEEEGEAGQAGDRLACVNVPL